MKALLIAILKRIRFTLRRLLGIEADVRLLIEYIQTLQNIAQMLLQRTNLLAERFNALGGITQNALLGLRDLHDRLSYYERTSETLRYLAAKRAHASNGPAPEEKPTADTNAMTEEELDLATTLNFAQEIHLEKLSAAMRGRDD